MTRRALMLEDDLERGNKIREILKHYGYATAWATSVEAAKSFWNAKRNNFELVLLDHDLGEGCGNGCQFVCWITQQPDAGRARYIVHSMNVVKAPIMAEDLARAGLHVTRVANPDHIGVYLSHE